MSERRGSTSAFYHGDALGSTRGITSSSQTVTDTALYDAFGMTVSRTGTNPTPFGFAGAHQYQSDTDTGLHLLGHRYYDPSIGRFLSQDPIRAGDSFYAYCRNEPLARIDPAGLQQSSVTTPRGQAELAEIAEEAAESIPKPTLPEPTTPGLIGRTITDIGKVVIGWGAGASGAAQALRNLSAADLQRMLQSGMTAQYARQLADFFWRFVQYLQQRGTAGSIDVAINRYLLMEMIARRLEFLEKIHYRPDGT